MAFCAMVCLVPLASSVEKSSTPWHSTTSSSGKSSSTVKLRFFFCKDAASSHLIPAFLRMP